MEIEQLKKKIKKIKKAKIGLMKSLEEIIKMSFKNLMMRFIQ